MILGVVEGVTEFLPVSSTGHLIITNQALGFESLAPIGATDRKGRIVTFKEAADTYTVIIQVGAIAAVAILYWGQLVTILAGLVGRNSAGLRLLRNLGLASIPPGLVGLAFQQFIKTRLFSIQTVAWALLVGALLMVVAEYWRRRREKAAPDADEATDLSAADLSPARALVVGLVQCFALWPGMSRSMTAMVAGYFVGLKPVRAAEFSFLLGLPLLGAASVKDAFDGGPAMVTAFGWGNLLTGLAVAFVCAALAVKLFVGFLTRRGLVPFAIYRVLLGLALLCCFVH